MAALRPRYAAEATRILKRVFHKSLDLPADELRRAEIVHVLDALTAKGCTAMAAKTAAFGKALFAWAAKRGAVEANPFIGLALVSLRARERVLGAGELAAVWRASDELGPYGAIVKLLLLQRREEVARMEWAELSGDLATWTIPGERAKNGKAHIVPLSRPAQELLRGIPKSNGRVFEFNNFSKCKAILDEKSGVTDWRLHDLRRTVATGMQRLGVRLEVTERVLNHISGSHSGIVGIYQRYDFATEKRHALQAWSENVMSMIEDRELDNVVVLRA